LKDYHHPKLDDLGDPCVDAAPWLELMARYPAEWHELVDSFHVVVDSFEKMGGTDADGTSELGKGRFKCGECAAIGATACFRTEKALDAHRRVRHAFRNQLKKYVDESGKCPVCHVQFSSRLRCIAHVSEKRKRARSAPTTSCREALMGGAFMSVSDDLLNAFDERDKLSRRDAVRVGRTQPKAAYTASRARIRAQPDGCSAGARIVSEPEPARQKRRLTA
jgi:hypothetical protein